MLNRTVAVSIAAAVLALATVVVAQTNGGEERFTFAVANASTAVKPGEDRFEIVVNRWSTDAERDTVFTELTKEGPQEAHEAIWNGRAAGYIKWPGRLDYTLRYARRVPQPDGSQKIVLATERKLWPWWESKDTSPSTDAFSVIELRVSGAKGEGKVVAAPEVTADKELGVAAKPDARQTVMLQDVRHDSTS